MANDGTRASDLSVAYEETDLLLPTAIGKFEIKRKFSSSSDWSSLPSGVQIFGATNNGSVGGAWFSSLSSYATYHYTPPDYSPNNSAPSKKTIQVRDTEGDLTTSIDFGDTLVIGDVIPTASGPSRLKRSGTVTVHPLGGTSVDIPALVTLIRPGEGHWEYEYASDSSPGGGQVAATYRLKKVFGAEYISSPICEFNYGLYDVCVLRPKPNAHSGGSRTAIPEQAERPFRAKANAHSGACRTPRNG